MRSAFSSDALPGNPLHISQSQQVGSSARRRWGRAADTLSVGRLHDRGGEERGEAGLCVQRRCRNVERNTRVNGEDTTLKDLMRMMSKVREISLRSDRDRLSCSRSRSRNDGKSGGAHDILICGRCCNVILRNHYHEDKCANCGVIICPSCGSPDIISDLASGQEVCTACGLVVHQIMLSLPPLSAASSSNMAAALHSEEEMSKAVLERAYLDLCDRAMLNEGMAMRASKEFQRLKKTERGEKISDKKLMAYSIYRTIFVEGSPRSPMEIAERTGVTKSFLCDMEALFPLPENSVTPESFIAAFFPRLGLADSRHEMVIESLCKRLTNVDAFDPRTVAATVIYLYCSKSKCVALGQLERDSSSSSSSRRFTIKEIASICGVSASSIARCRIIAQRELSVKH